MNNRGSFGQVVLGLSIFLIGSIAITYFISPDSFKSVGASINNLVSPSLAKVLPSQTYVILVPAQMEEYNPPVSSSYSEYIKNTLSCSSIEANGEASGVSDSKGILCQEACGKRNMNYWYNSCDKNILSCYCKP